MRERESEGERERERVSYSGDTLIESLTSCYATIRDNPPLGGMNLVQHCESHERISNDVTFLVLLLQLAMRVPDIIRPGFRYGQGVPLHGLHQLGASTNQRKNIDIQL